MPPTTAPYLNLTTTSTTTNTTPSSPTACTVIMCANVVGMFLHSTHFGWVRSAGSRGLAAFEEVVALHGVPCYIEVSGGDDDDDDILPQPVPFDLYSSEGRSLSNAKVVLTCNKYEYIANPDVEISTRFKHPVDDFIVNCGTFFLSFIDELRVKHLRFVAGLAITEVGDEGGYCGPNENIKAKSVELIGFENVTRVRVGMFYNFTKITTVDLSPLRNVTEIGQVFLSECSRLESIDFSPLKSLNSIDDGCMVGCKALTTISFTGLTNLSTIGVAFMQRCSRIVSVDLSPLVGLTVIGSEFVSGCSRLKTVQLPNAKGLTTITRNFFARCTSLTNINLWPLKSVTSVDTSFLSDCRSLTSLDLTPFSKVKNVKGLFLDGCSSLILRRTNNLSRAIRIALHGEGHAIYCKDDDDDDDNASSEDSDEHYDYEDDTDASGDRLWARDNDIFDKNNRSNNNGWATGSNLIELFADRAATGGTPTQEDIHAFVNQPRPPPPAQAPPYLDVTFTTPNTTLSSPTACNVLMCVNVVGMFLHSAHFGWVRSAGSRGLAAFEEVVALHGVPSYIEVKKSKVGDVSCSVDTVALPPPQPQPVPLWLRTKVHNIFEGTVAVRCRSYPTPPMRYIDALCEDYYLIWHGETGGASSLDFISERKISRVRLIADASVTEVGDDDDIIEDLEEKFIYARSVELVGFTNVTKVMEAVLYRYKYIRTINLSPLRNVTEIGMLFLSSCSRLKSVDLSPLVNLTRIGRSFLSGNKSLQKVNFTGLKKVTTIGEYFMYACKSLASINLSHLEGVTQVGANCLGRCPSVNIKHRGQLNQVFQEALMKSGH